MSVWPAFEAYRFGRANDTCRRVANPTLKLPSFLAEDQVSFQHSFEKQIQKMTHLNDGHLEIAKGYVFRSSETVHKLNLLNTPMYLLHTIASS